MQKVETFLKEKLLDPLSAATNAEMPVGYVGLDLPMDIRFSSDRLFCHLPWDKEQATPNADKWLESAFPGWARSILENWIAGKFDMFETVIFSRGDDACQRLYYYLCELRSRGIARGPEPLIFDVAMIPRRTSIGHCMNMIERLLQRFELTVDDLEKGITRANDYRRFYSQLDSDRGAPGHIVENIARADLFFELLPELSSFTMPTSSNLRPLLLAGSVPPDDSFHIAAEAAGWNIVGELHQRSITRFGSPIDVSNDDPLLQVASRLNESKFGPRTFSDYGMHLLGEIDRTGAEAVVLWLTLDDESQAWHAARSQHLLAEKGIPSLVMTSRRWDGKDSSTTEITEFLKELSI